MPLFWMNIDLLVTIVCILLIFAWNKKAMNCLCCICLKCLIVNKELLKNNISMSKLSIKSKTLGNNESQIPVSESPTLTLSRNNIKRNIPRVPSFTPTISNTSMNTSTEQRQSKSSINIDGITFQNYIKNFNIDCIVEIQPATRESTPITPIKEGIEETEDIQDKTDGNITTFQIS